MNLYQFALNDPINKFDAFGLYTINNAYNSLEAKGVAKLGINTTIIYDSSGNIVGLEAVYYYTDEQVFNEWLSLEQSSGQWWTSLPKCPTKICFKEDGTPKSPNSSIWDTPSGASQTYHPGAVWEMRTKSGVQGSPHGNQCTYDADGALVTSYPAAGSADYYAPHGLNVLNHYYHDVATYELAQTLNRVSDYFSVRPVW